MSTRPSVLVVLASLVSGCSVATNVRQNTEAINNSSAAIKGNTAAVQESTKGTSALVPALEGAERLRQPLTDVARLEPTLKSVASLGEPLGRVAGLDGSLRGVAALEQPITRLVGLGQASIAPPTCATRSIGWRRCGRPSNRLPVSEDRSNRWRRWSRSWRRSRNWRISSQRSRRSNPRSTGSADFNSHSNRSDH